MIATCLLPSLTAALAAPLPAPLPTILEPIPAAYSWTSAPLPLQDDDVMDLSYTFVELGLTTTDIHNLEEDADTYYLAGSLALGMFQIVAAYENTELDVGDTDADTFRLGAGAHFGLSERLDVQGDISYLYNDTSGIFSESSSGYEIRGGLRWLALPWSNGGLELAGNILYRDLENAIASDEDQFGYELQGRAHFLKLFSVGASYIERADDQSYLFNARLSL